MCLKETREWFKELWHKRKRRCNIAYEIGTASDYQDLLERLKDFLSDKARTIGDHPNMDELVAIDDLVDSGEASQEWTINRWVDGRISAPAKTELIMNGPGLAGTENIYVGMQCEDGTLGAGDYYNWIVNGFTGYSSGDDFLDQPGALPSDRAPSILLWDSTIPYWFIGNGRRVVVIAKVSGVYETMYLGHMLPYGTPTQVPYPIVVGGSFQNAAIRGHYSDVSADHSSFIDNRDSSSTLCTLWALWTSEWRGFYTSTTADFFTFPYQPTANLGEMDHIWRTMRGTMDGTGAVIFPIVLFAEDNNIAAMGNLDGIVAVSHDSPVAEDTVIIGGDTYIIFPNTYHLEQYSFFAIKKE